jgi:outer membrane protein
MKRIISLVLIMGLIIPSICVAQDLKIGYVDILKVFNEYKKTKDYDDMLEKRKNIKEKELEKKKEEIKRRQEKLDLLKDEEQKKEREEIAKIAGEYREMERQYILDLRKERDEKMKEIIKDINKVVENYANKKDFDLILNKAAVLYGKKDIDLTDIILKIVNQRYKK